MLGIDGVNGGRRQRREEKEKEEEQQQQQQQQEEEEDEGEAVVHPSAGAGERTGEETEATCVVQRAAGWKGKSS